MSQAAGRPIAARAGRRSAPAHAEPPLLERSGELAMLTAAWRAAKNGQGSAWLITAEAGGGKTALAVRFAAQIDERVRWGATEPVAPPEPWLAVTRALPEFVPQPTRSASLQAALAQLEAESAGDPLLIVLDDLHDADEATIAFAVRLAATCLSRPWLALFTLRPGEGPQGVLTPLLELAAKGELQRRDLPPLSAVGIRALAAAVSGRSWNPAELEQLTRESGGIPWYVEALAREQGSASIRDRVTLRIAALEAATPGTRQMLEALGPATGPLPHPLVVQLCPEVPDPLSVLRALRDAHVLVEEPGGWSFRHQLLRRIVAENLLDVERQQAHRAIAELLAGAPVAAERRAALIAMHFAEAGDARAVAWADHAATEARAVEAHSEAMAQLQRALSFVEEPERRRDLLMRAAREASDLGQPTQMLAFAQAAIALPGGDPDAIARQHQLAARAAYLLGDLNADTQHLAAAAQALQGHPVTDLSAEIAATLVGRAGAAVEPDRLQRASESALRVAEALGDRRVARWLRLTVEREQAVSRIIQGDPSACITIADLASRFEGEQFPGSNVGNVLSGGYQAAVVGLQLGQATALYTRFAAAIHHYELRWEGFIQPHRVLELVQRGAIAEARMLALAMTPPQYGTVQQAVVLTAVALAELRAGSRDQAQALISNAASTPNFHARAMLSLAYLEVAIAEGAPDLGELAQQTYALMNRHRYTRPAGVAALALARSGRGAPPDPPWLVSTAPLRVYWRWARALAAGDADELRRVAAEWESMSCPYEAASALRDAGELRIAYARFRELGAERDREQVADLIRRAGQPVPRRDRAGRDTVGLSETERRLCVLVAAGASNPEIAKQLVISVRTVETHLTHIYRKTNSRGRAALATWWSTRNAE